MTIYPKDIMANKIFTVRRDVTLPEARKLMTEKRVRHFPVVNEEQEIIGIVSSKDLAVGLDLPQLRVEHVMSTPVEFVEETTPLKDSIYRILNRKISSLIVIDDKREAVGIFTSDDLLFYLAQLLEEKQEKGTSWLDAAKMTVGRLMDQLAAMGI